MTQKISPAVFSSAAPMASAMRRLSTPEIITSPAPRGAVALSRPSVRPKRKLPDAPAPPNEPPPPEKPPPPGKPPDQDEPGIGMKIGPREPRRGPAPVGRWSWSRIPPAWLEPGLGRRVENSGIIDHTAGELREGERIGRKRDYGQEQSENRTTQRRPKSRQHDQPIRDDPRHLSAPTRQNFTVGGLVTSSATVNVSIGL